MKKVTRLASAATTEENVNKLPETKQKTVEPGKEHPGQEKGIDAGNDSRPETTAEVKKGKYKHKADGWDRSMLFL